MAKKKSPPASPFVPVEEQPYSIPENWCWVKLSALSSMISKGTTPTGGKDTYVDTGINFVRVENLNDDGTISHENIAHITENVHTGFLKRSILQENDILISIAGTLGKTGVVRDVDLPLNTNQALAFVRISSHKISKKYIKNAINSKIIQEILLGKTRVTSIPNLTLEIISNCPIPLAPVLEQHRIVARIESLFAKLDEAKEKAQAVVDDFELRKSAILHKAFTGELTERWRKEHGVGMDSWKQLSIASICHSLKYGTAKKSEKSGSVVVLRMGNLQQGEIDWSDLAYSSDMDDIEKYRLEAGDVLFNRTNSAALVGKTSIYRGEYPAIYAGYLIKLDYDHEIVTGDFLNYALNTDRAKEYCNTVKTDGVNQSNINAKKIGAYMIPVPKIDEQKEIVKLLQKLFALEKQAKEAAEAVLGQIDTMKKTILARAFRGELGTNDPAEEWAGELVKEILQKKEG